MRRSLSKLGGSSVVSALKDSFCSFGTDDQETNFSTQVRAAKILGYQVNVAARTRFAKAILRTEAELLHELQHRGYPVPRIITINRGGYIRERLRVLPREATQLIYVDAEIAIREFLAPWRWGTNSNERLPIAVNLAGEQVFVPPDWTQSLPWRVLRFSSQSSSVASH